MSPANRIGSESLSIIYYPVHTDDAGAQKNAQVWILSFAVCETKTFCSIFWNWRVAQKSLAVSGNKKALSMHDCYMVHWQTCLTESQRHYIRPCSQKKAKASFWSDSKRQKLKSLVFCVMWAISFEKHPGVRIGCFPGITWWLMVSVS